MVSERENRGEQTRDRIIAAAMELVHESGRDGFTTRNVIRRAGISKGALYHHFQSMDDVLESIMDAMFRYFTDAVASAACDNVYDFILFVGMADIDIILEHIDLGKKGVGFLDDFIRKDRLRQKMIDATEQFKTMLKRRIAALVNSDVSEKSINDVVSMIIVSLIGVETFLYIARDPEEFRETWKKTAGMLAEYLENRNGRFE